MIQKLEILIPLEAYEVRVEEKRIRMHKYT